MTRLACIVGSGFSRERFAQVSGDVIETRYGATSSPIVATQLGGVDVVLLARHGPDHRWAPHEVNYRANIQALRDIGVTHCIGFNVVGGIASHLAPGELAVPHQLIDYTWGRPSSFDMPGEGVTHIEFTQPFSAQVRVALEHGCVAADRRVYDGVYGVTQGPRLETAAEVDRLERDGCDMVGMTALPEAALAREAGIEYAVLAGVVNHAAGRAPGGRSLHAQMREILAAVMDAGQRVIEHAAVSLCHRDL